MIPRALPKLMTDAVRNAWSVHLDAYPSSTHADFKDRGQVTVHMEWADGRITYSEINGTPTPYTQCVALIRSSPEGDPQ